MHKRGAAEDGSQVAEADGDVVWGRVHGRALAGKCGGCRRSCRGEGLQPVKQKVVGEQGPLVANWGPTNACKASWDEMRIAGLG